MAFDSPDPRALRAARTFDALMRLGQRFAGSPQARTRFTHPEGISPTEAVRAAALLGGGAVAHLEGEPPLDEDDVIAALTLVPHVWAEIDELELSLLQLARLRGMPWVQVAFALGLASPQAAQQRHHRLASRTNVED